MMLDLHPSLKVVLPDVLPQIGSLTQAGLTGICMLHLADMEDNLLDIAALQLAGACGELLWLLQIIKGNGNASKIAFKHGQVHPHELLAAFVLVVFGIVALLTHANIGSTKRMAMDKATKVNDNEESWDR